MKKAILVLIIILVGLFFNVEKTIKIGVDNYLTPYFYINDNGYDDIKWKTG